MVPRIFHQIWLGAEPFPREYEAYQQSWLRRHPGWELRFWTEDELPDDLARAEIYERLRRPAERSDLLRFELLARHGGVYLDADFECLRSIEPLLAGVTFFCAYNDPGRVNNAIVGCTQGHTLALRAVSALRPRDTYGPVDKDGTGPLFLNRLIAGHPDVTIFAEELFYPRTPAAREHAYAVHHAARSWKDPADLLLDAVRAEQRLALLQDEHERLGRKHAAAVAETEQLRRRLRGERSAAFAALGLRMRRALVLKRSLGSRIRPTLGRLRRLARER